MGCCRKIKFKIIIYIVLMLKELLVKVVKVLYILFFMINDGDKKLCYIFKFRNFEYMWFILKIIYYCC